MMQKAGMNRLADSVRGPWNTRAGTHFYFLTGGGCDTRPRVEDGREGVLMKGAFYFSLIKLGLV